MEKNQVTLFKGTSKKTGKEYRAVKVVIGEWTTLVFPQTKFEMDYIEKILTEAGSVERQQAHDDFQSDMEI